MLFLSHVLNEEAITCLKKIRFRPVRFPSYLGQLTRSLKVRYESKLCMRVCEHVSLDKNIPTACLPQESMWRTQQSLWLGHPGWLLRGGEVETVQELARQLEAGRIRSRELLPAGGEQKQAGHGGRTRPASALRSWVQAAENKFRARQAKEGAARAGGGSSCAWGTQREMPRGARPPSRRPVLGRPGQDTGGASQVPTS